MVVVENGPSVHNLIVCTCALAIDGQCWAAGPSDKSAPTSSRAVIDPRGILREFGTQVAEEVEVRVWDSTAELRYIVLRERPAGTGERTEDELVALITRDAMIGVAKSLCHRAGTPQNGVFDMAALR